MTVNAQKIIDSAVDRCLRAGVRMTKKRRLILSCLLKQKKPLSAYGIIDAYNEEQGEKLPATSVYRILKFLEENNLVHKLQGQNKYIACAHIVCDHVHSNPQFLICQKCDRVEEIQGNDALIGQIRKRIGETEFQLVSPQLEMICVCKDCMV